MCIRDRNRKPTQHEGEPMTPMKVAVIGGGIIGTAIARRLLQVRPDANVTVLEKEPVLAGHQTGHNSGVVHAGLYYTPGSLKARLCRRGVSLLRDYCTEHGLTYDECGKVLVALDETEDARLDDIICLLYTSDAADDLTRVDLAGRRVIEKK